ncbi:PASTA domain-containing protein [Streptomyces sp. G45]|uniref:PASTA domain-containing protein n=1 Tax=Streptomyces sp. G45 TaxID=3406627 RepID=UPI003C24A8CD
MPQTPGYAGPPEVRVPRLLGLMAMDARDAAAAHGVRIEAGDRAAFHEAALEYVVRQYPVPGTEVPRGAVVTVWFELGPEDDEGGAGVREPRWPRPPDGGLLRELAEPGRPEEPEVGVSGW